MEQDDFNRLLQNAIEQSRAQLQQQLQQQHEEQLKVDMYLPLSNI